MPFQFWSFSASFTFSRGRSSKPRSKGQDNLNGLIIASDELVVVHESVPSIGEIRLIIKAYLSCQLCIGFMINMSPQIPALNI
jgi:hypothetical protein